MPYFIHLDDIEYGMRNYNNGIILLNGISVWHPSFVNKSPLWYGYYDMRNQLLTCSMTDYFNAMTLYSAYFKNKSFWDVIDMMIFRHQTFVWLLHIMKCFCKGPETLLNLDALTLQKELTLCKLETASLEDYGFTKEDIVAPSLRKKRIARLLLVLCSLLPFRHGVKLVSSYNLDYPFFCKKLYIYHEENKLCECLNFSRLSMKRKLILYFYHYFNIRLKWKSLVLQWKRSREVFTSIEFWKKYLGI